MAALVKRVFNPVLVKNGIYGKQFVRLAGYWNKDWKPGPYPKTDAERIAAAKKYGMLPQDYEPYPDDGTGYGDYPKLPLVSADEKDPFKTWDEPDQRRNFGEVMNVDYDAYTEERLTTVKPRYTFKQMWAATLGVIGGYVLITLFFEWKGWRVKQLWGPKQMPGQGKTHYTFESVD